MYKYKRCGHCGVFFKNGDLVTECGDCGTLHHVECVISKGGCAGYSCEGSTGQVFVVNEDEQGHRLPETEEQHRQVSLKIEELRSFYKKKRADDRIKQYQEEEKRRMPGWLKAILILLILTAVSFGAFLGIRYWQNSSNMSRAEQCLMNGNTEDALMWLESVDPTVVGEERYRLIKYLTAIELRDGEYYAEAYTAFTELGDCMDSADRRNNVILSWAGQVAKSTSRKDAEEFLKTVKITCEADQLAVFNAVDWGMDLVTDSTLWFDYGAKTPIFNCLDLLEMLPSEYQHNWVLQDFLRMLADSKDYEEVFVENKSWVPLMWSLELMEKMATCDDGIKWFLVGEWEDSSGDYYFRFTEDEEENGIIHASYNIKAQKEPNNVAYYDIQDCIYVWLTEDEEKVDDVFKFQIVDYETIYVTAIEYGKTYILRRSGS